MEEQFHPHLPHTQEDSFGKGNREGRMENWCKLLHYTRKKVNADLQLGTTLKAASAPMRLKQRTRMMVCVRAI